MAAVKPLLSFRIEQSFMDRLDRHWRLHTKHRHLSDAARQLLEQALDRAEAEAAAPAADAPGAS